MNSLIMQALTPGQITELAARLFVAYKQMDVGRIGNDATDRTVSTMAIESAKTFAQAVEAHAWHR